MVAPFVTAAIALAEFAPTITKWFSQSGNSLENTQKIASDVIGIAKKMTQQDNPLQAVQMLTQNPQLLLEFQQALAKMDQEIEHDYLQDRMDARHRDAAIIAAGRSNTRADIMVISAAMGLILCLVALGYYQGDLPGEAVGIISTIAGIFGGCLKDAYAFEFGSSRGSKTKDLVALLGNRNY